MKHHKNKLSTDEQLIEDYSNWVETQRRDFHEEINDNHVSKSYAKYVINGLFEDIFLDDQLEYLKKIGKPIKSASALKLKIRSLAKKSDSFTGNPFIDVTGEYYG